MQTWEKDARLDALAEAGWNVARFMSFAPDGSPRFRRLSEGSSDQDHRSVADIAALFRLGATRVNIRCFTPESTQTNPFDYGLATANEAVAQAQHRLAEGFYVIVNETIDQNDGGVSGVAEGGVWEFAPDATPRVVEKGPTCALDERMARHILRRVYGEVPDSPAPTRRLEWSIHPQPVGFRQQRWIVWEEGASNAAGLRVEVNWPNPFSRLVGDKTFGLLVADSIDILVPHTTVMARRVAPFTFGRPTGSAGRWTRTAPVVARPGKFTTRQGWTDPFALLADEDPHGNEIAAVLFQESVPPVFSGAALPSLNDGYVVEGVPGRGDDFMLGEVGPSPVPVDVVESVQSVLVTAAERVGRVRAEWVFDGSHVWIVQLHRATDNVAPGVLNVGQPRSGWLEVSASEGLDTIRVVVDRARAGGYGVRVLGAVGVTSHIGDVVRRAGVPGVVVML